MKKVNLSVNIGSLVLKNPVMAASGTFGYAEEFKDFIDLRKLGAVVTKTVTLKKRRGNPPPRTCETYAGMLNSIGLENPGLDAFLGEKLPILAKIGVPIIVSIASESDIGEFITLAERLDELKEVSAIELNISCPNIRGARLVAQDPKATYNLVGAVRKAAKKTLITKLSPNVTDITKIARSAKEAGSDAVSLVNTFLGMAVDIESGMPKLGGITGGLSGPAIKPIALRMVREVFDKVNIPIIGIGGIMDYKDALEFILCGAAAVQVGTANFVNPRATIEIIEGIEGFMRSKKIRGISQLVGSLRVKEIRIEKDK